MALGLSVATDNGFQPVVSIAVTDGGVQKAVSEAWVFNNGSFRRFWPAQGSIVSFTASLGAIPFRDVTLAWDTAFVSNLTISQTEPTTGLVAFVSMSPFDGSAPLTLAPSTTYSFSLSITDPLGLKTSKTAKVVTAAIPAPTITTRSTGTLSGSSYPVTLTWTSIAGVSYYQLWNAATNTILQDNITTNSVTRNYAASTTHKVFVRAVYKSSTSTYYSANGTTYTWTTAAAGPPAGSYVFRPTNCAVWTTATDWRDASDSLYHGWYSSNRGTQTSMFFGYLDSSSRPFTSSYYDNATVTKVEVYVSRGTSGGSSTPTASRFVQHNHATKPQPADVKLGTSYDDSSNPLGYGESGWITIPNSWGTALLNGTIKGVGWGNVSNGRYMVGPWSATTNLTKSTPIGSVRITVG